MTGPHALGWSHRLASRLAASFAIVLGLLLRQACLFALRGSRGVRRGGGWLDGRGRFFERQISSAVLEGMLAFALSWEVLCHT